jgi:hypothetical protein
MASNIAIDAQFRMVRPIQIESSKERGIHEVGIILVVRLKRRVMFAVDEEFEAVAIGEDGSGVAGTAGRRWTKVPIKIWDDYWAHGRADLGLIKGGA